MLPNIKYQYLPVGLITRNLTIEKHNWVKITVEFNHSIPIKRHSISKTNPRTRDNPFLYG